MVPALRKTPRARPANLGRPRVESRLWPLLWSAILALAFFASGLRAEIRALSSGSASGDDIVRYDQALGPLASLTSLLEAECEEEEEERVESDGAIAGPGRITPTAALVGDPGFARLTRHGLLRTRLTPRLTRGPPRTNLA